MANDPIIVSIAGRQVDIAALGTMIVHEIVSCDPVTVYLFGSRVEGNVRSDSDIDIAFIPRRPVSSYEVFLAAQRVADRVRCEVDLVDLSRSTAVMRVQVIGKAHVIYDGDRSIRENFEMQTLSDYARLNEERRPVLAAMGMLDDR